MATSIKRSKSLAVSSERRTMCRVDIRNMSTGELNWPTPMKAIGAQNLLTMPGGVTISGYLHKRGGKQLQLFKWPLRYVIIHKGCVYYFKSSTSAASQGAFSLNGYNRVMRAAEETTSNNVFPFKMVHISKKHRTWYFSAASEEERKKWMLNLRKEIDHYHEKKETFTDLSDTDTDTDSFYGSVERPVDIKYTHNPEDDSWQDEDDDEEDYVEPDGLDDSAPSYPPPPIPRLPKPQSEEPQRRLSLNDNPGTPKPPSPLPRPSTGARLDLTCKGYNMRSCLPDSGGRPPPIPTLPPAHRPEVTLNNPPPPPPPVRSPVDKAESVSVCPRKDPPGPAVHRNKKIPSPTHQLPSHPAEPLSRPRNDSIPNQAKDAKFGFQQPPMLNDLLNKELSSRLNKTSPTVPKKPSSKSGQMVAPVRSFHPELPKQMPINVCPPPVPQNKPKILVEVEKAPETSLPPMIKPVLPKPRALPKAHPPSKSQKKPLDCEKPRFPPILRSSPDGQSIIDVPIEEGDSDEDYEKVALPATVFVNTCESADIESIFKAADTRGEPPTGLFCIRNSSKGGKVLVVWDGDIARLRNYRIFEKGSRFYLEAEILFSDIESLIEHYYKNKLPSHENLILKYAYGYPSHPR